MIKCICDSCNLNFCLTHRHPNDHSCEGKSTVAQRSAAAAADRAAAAANKRAGAQSTQSRITNFFTGPFRPEQGTENGRSGVPNRPTGSRQAASGSRQAVASLQNGMSEDEALAAALAASMTDCSMQQQSSTAALTQVNISTVLQGYIFLDKSATPRPPPY